MQSYRGLLSTESGGLKLIVPGDVMVPICSADTGGKSDDSDGRKF